MRTEVKDFILSTLRDIIYKKLEKGEDVSKFQGTFHVLDIAFRDMKKEGEK